MFVVFEGIDGSGKTTVSSRVAKRLRAEGMAIEHVREDGEFASPLVRRLRDFGKDPRNLALEPMAEVLLYLAREAQILSELTRPALARGGLVFADRYLYSYEVLGCHGRGLDPGPVRAAMEAVAAGMWPDLVVLLDADPHVARARRKAAKLEARGGGREVSTGSRKGLAGVGAQRRVREGYLELAARDPGRWMVIDNGAAGVGVEETVERVAGEIRRRVDGGTGERGLEQATGDRRQATGDRPRAAEEAQKRFWEVIEQRAEKEPGVAAYFLAGLENPEAHEWRERLITRVPHVVAYGLRGLVSERAWEFREKLVDASPLFVARSVSGVDVTGSRADAMRLALAEAQPVAVLATLRGDDGAVAWQIRDRMADRDLGDVVASLERLASERAWELRHRYLRERAGDHALADPAPATAVATSLRGLDGEEAWHLRRAAFDAAPVAVIESLVGLTDDESWLWRDRWIERATRAVLSTLSRLDDPRAWAMRRRTAPRAKEALDGMAGSDAADAWTLREDLVGLWPSTAVKSLGPLIAGARGASVVARALAVAPGDISLLKHLCALAHDAAASARLEEET